MPIFTPKSLELLYNNFKTIVIPGIRGLTNAPTINQVPQPNKFIIDLLQGLFDHFEADNKNAHHARISILHQVQFLKQNTKPFSPQRGVLYVWSQEIDGKEAFYYYVESITNKVVINPLPIPEEWQNCSLNDLIQKLENEDTVNSLAPLILEATYKKEELIAGLTLFLLQSSFVKHDKGKNVEPIISGALYVKPEELCLYDRSYYLNAIVEYLRFATQSNPAFLSNVTRYKYQDFISEAVKLQSEISSQLIEQRFAGYERRKLNSRDYDGEWKGMIEDAYRSSYNPTFLNFLRQISHILTSVSTKHAAKGESAALFEKTVGGKRFLQIKVLIEIISYLKGVSPRYDQELSQEDVLDAIFQPAYYTLLSYLWIISEQINKEYSHSSRFNLFAKETNSALYNQVLPVLLQAIFKVDKWKDGIEMQDNTLYIEPSKKGKKTVLCRFLQKKDDINLPNIEEKAVTLENIGNIISKYEVDILLEAFSRNIIYIPEAVQYKFANIFLKFLEKQLFEGGSIENQRTKTSLFDSLETKKNPFCIRNLYQFVLSLELKAKLALVGQDLEKRIQAAPLWTMEFGVIDDAKRMGVNQSLGHVDSLQNTLLHLQGTGCASDSDEEEAEANYSPN